MVDRILDRAKRIMVRDLLFDRFDLLDDLLVIRCVPTFVRRALIQPDQMWTQLVCDLFDLIMGCMVARSRSGNWLCHNDDIRRLYS